MIELRQAMRAIYAEKSLSISDCYRLDRIRKVECIYYDVTDKESKQLAEILQKQIEEYFFQPVLMQAVKFNLTAKNYYLGWKETLKFISSEKTSQRTLVICNSIVARILLEFESIDELSSKFFMPDYILDVNEYREEEFNYWKKVPAEISFLKDKKAIYHKKSYKMITNVIVLLSSLDSMDDVLEIDDCRLENIIIINDCKNAPSWFIKKQTKKLKKAMSNRFPEIKIKQYGEDEFKTKIAALDLAIMFVPQNKTWWKYYASPEVFFCITSENNIDVDHMGPMDFQAFVDDMKQFALLFPDSETSQKILSEYKYKHFNCINRFIYWMRQLT